MTTAISAASEHFSTSGTSSPDKASKKQTAITFSTNATTATSITAISPFTCVGDDDTYTNLSDDMDESVMEGIDVVGAADGPETFLQWARLTSGKLVRSQWFKRAVLMAILVNSILMGVATSEWARENPSLWLFLNKIIRFFRVVFSLEIFLDVLHYQQEALKMGWILFDVAVLVLSWFGSLSFLVMRSFRLIRALRKASGAAGLNHLVEALLRVIPKMTAVVFLIALVFYIFAVVFTDLYQDLYDTNDLSYDYFGALDRSAFTLFQVMTLDGWSDIAKELMEVQPWSCALFVLFIILTSFFFTSLVISVVGEAFASVANERIVKALEVDHATAMKISGQQELAKLEKRVEDLATAMERMLKVQHAIQEALNSQNSEKE